MTKQKRSFQSEHVANLPNKSGKSLLAKRELLSDEQYLREN